MRFLIIMSICLLASQAWAQRISLECNLDEGYQLDLIKKNYPELFDMTRLVENYKKSGLKVPEQAELEKIALDMFLALRKLEIKSIEVDKDFIEDPWINLNGEILRTVGEEAKWSPQTLTYIEYFPAMTNTYIINRSSLEFTGYETPFPPNFKRRVRWVGRCRIIPEPDNKF